MERLGRSRSTQKRGCWRPGMVGHGGLWWSVGIRHVLWLLLLWTVCGLHLLYLFASYTSQPTATNNQMEVMSSLVARKDSTLRPEEGISTLFDYQVNKRIPKSRFWIEPSRLRDRASKPIWKLAPDDEEQEQLLDQSLPQHLEGPQLRHLADIDSFISRASASKTDNEESPKKSLDGEVNFNMLSMDRILQHTDGIAQNGESKVDSGEILLQPKQPNQDLIPPNSVPDGYRVDVSDAVGSDSEPQFSNRPEGWVACPSMSRSNVQPPVISPSSEGSEEEPGWQIVRPGQSYVFSAYHDPRPLLLGGIKALEGVVRVIALADTHVDGAPQFCQLWYTPSVARPGARSRIRRKGQYMRGQGAQGRPLDAHLDAQRTPNRTLSGGVKPRAWKRVIVPAISDIVPETHGLRFAPFIYTCRLGSSVIPAGVSLTHSRCDNPLNYLEVKAAHSPKHNSYPHQQQPYNYTVCVTPFNFNYNNVDQLVEKLEVDKMFGANKFIFYNFSSGPGIIPYLNSYIREGAAKVIQWKLPVRVDTWPTVPVPEVDVHYFGQLAALNDCLYRNMFYSKMIVFTDMDELIVPRKHRRWRDMVEFLYHKGQGNAGTFIFQNTFFRTEWSNDDSLSYVKGVDLDKNNADVMKIMSLAKTKRERYIYPWGMRSKYICDPLKVEMVGVHNIWRFVNENYTELDVPTDIGLLHHYRSWNKAEEDNVVLDRTMHTYWNKVVSLIRSRHRKVEESSTTL